MSAVGGNFRGEGEQIEVVLEDDDYWYLRGKSKQNSLVGKAISIHFVQ